MIEKRKPFPKPYDRYYISSIGRVKYYLSSRPRKLEIGGGRPVATIRDLSNGGKNIKFQINRLVYCIFNGISIKKLIRVGHKDGDKFNNSLDNLFRVQQRGIVNKIAIKRGIMKIPVNNKLTKRLVNKIRYEYKILKGKNKYNRDMSYKVLSKNYGVSSTCIGDIISGKSWNTINKHFSNFKMLNKGK